MKQLQPKLTPKIVKEESKDWYLTKTNPLPIRCYWGKGQVSIIKDFNTQEHAKWFIDLYNLIKDFLAKEASVFVDKSCVQISTKKKHFQIQFRK
jgi:hypothetical protein